MSTKMIMCCNQLCVHNVDRACKYKKIVIDDNGRCGCYDPVVINYEGHEEVEEQEDKKIKIGFCGECDEE